MQTINEILVVRNDKIGDFILILPALSWLKKNIPNCRITCIVSEKVLDLANQCEHIDSVIIDKSILTLRFKKKKKLILLCLLIISPI